MKMRCFRPKLPSRARAPSLTTTAHFVGSGRFQAVSSSREHALHAPDVRSDIRFGPWRRCSPLFTPTAGAWGRSYSSQYLSAHCVKQPISDPIEHTDHHLTSRAHQIAGLVVCDEFISSNAKIPHIYSTRLPDPPGRYEYITPLRNTPDASIPPSANSHSIENRKAQTHAKTPATEFTARSTHWTRPTQQNEHTSPKNKQTLPKKRPHIAKKKAPHTRPPSSAAVQRRCAGGAAVAAVSMAAVIPMPKKMILHPWV